MRAPTKQHKIHILYSLNFLFNLAIAIPTYVNSTFIATFIGEDSVGLVYTLGSAAAIVGLAFIAPILRRTGNYAATVALVIVGAATMLGIAFSSQFAAIGFFFLVYLIMTRLVGYNIDLLLESFSRDKTTGSIRGAFLAISNVAWVIAPVISGFVLGTDNYWRIYTLAGILLILLIPTLVYNFRHYRDPVYHRLPFWKTLRMIFKHPDLSKIFSAYTLLRFFYAWMVIYTPIYLHTHIGLPWTTIGIIFTVMLLPFILLEYPLGKLADTRLGEKEIMTAGFVVLAVASATLSLITTPSVILWALALFATRVGASMVEVTGETYFFKKIDGADSDLLGFFRMTGPLAYIMAPLVASFVLVFIDIRFLFVVLGVLMLSGMWFSLRLHDTR